MKERDWLKLKLEYATGTISYRKMAEKYGVPFKTLSDHARKEEWAKARNKHREKVVQKTIQKTSEKQATEHAKKLLKVGRAADSLASVIDAVFKDAEQFKRYIVTEGLGMGATDVKERKFDKVDTKAIRDLSASLKDLATVLRSVYDLPTITEKSAMEIAIQRLRLDETKAGMGDQDETETGVVELAPVLGGGANG